MITTIHDPLTGASIHHSKSHLSPGKTNVRIVALTKEDCNDILAGYREAYPRGLFSTAIPTGDYFTALGRIE